MEGRMSVAHIESPSSATSTLRGDLRARIGWICHALRIAAVVWISWGTVWTLVSWSHKAGTLAAYGYWFSADFSGVSDARYAAALVAVFLSLAAGVPVVICIWRLVGTYLAGRVFTVDAALWLRRIGIAGIAAIVISIIARAVAASIIVGQPVSVPPRGSFVLPQDLLHLIFVGFVLALAHIFKAAAEMAEDHAQIV
jgi:Protein of unknown function (DUF2975)